jgi:Spy/CpxP family protein refolding chaperone
MTKRRTILLIVLLALMWSLTSAQTPNDETRPDSMFQTPIPDMMEPPFFAQGDDSGFGPRGMFPGGGHGPGRLNERQRKHLEQFRMFELLKFLDLSDDQEVDFLTGYKKLRSDQDELDATKREYIDQLKDGLKADSLSDERINTLVSNIQGIDKQKLEVAQKFVNEMRGVLTPAQLGKFVVFQEEFEYELLKRLRGFHQRGGGPMQNP